LGIAQLHVIQKNGLTTVEKRTVQKTFVSSQVNAVIVTVNIEYHLHIVQFLKDSKIKERIVSFFQHPSAVKNKMRILFINCQSFKTAYGLSDTIEKYNIDILCLNETFENDKNPVRFKDWNVYSSPRPNQTRGGVAICIKPNSNFISEQIKNNQLQSIEMTCVKITFKDSQTQNIWCPYVPPDKPNLMEDLCKQITEKMPENTIIIGDFNAKSYQWNNINENSHGKLLEDTMTQNKLICINDGQATRRQSKSVIDLALVMQCMYKKVIECSTLV